MPAPNLFLDTNILLDYVVPYRRKLYQCSVELIEKIKNGDFEGWIIDYALSETLGELKSEKEKRMGTQKVARETVSRYDIAQMVAIIEGIKKIPHINIFFPSPVPQSDIFDKVQNICVQATDALVLLSVLELAKKIPDVTLVTRDERLRVRGSRTIRTAHPITYLNSCPAGCSSATNCVHKKT